MFLPPALTRSANRYVREVGPEDKNPVFRRNAPGLVEVNGAILRYSTTSEAGE